MLKMEIKRENYSDVSKKGTVPQKEPLLTKTKLQFYN